MKNFYFHLFFTFLSTLRDSTVVHCQLYKYEITLTKPPKGAVVTPHIVHKQNSTNIYDSTLQVNKDTLGSNLKSIVNQYGDTVVL